MISLGAGAQQIPQQPKSSTETNYKEDRSMGYSN